MPGVLALLNAPALALRIFFNVVSAGSGASVVAATVIVGVVVVSKWNTPDHSGDLFHDVTVVLKSDGTLAFNRAIQSFERDEYYNATATLLDLTERLNAHLKQKFPTTFVKAITANFSLKPEITPTRKRRYPYCHECYLKLMAARVKRDPRVPGIGVDGYPVLGSFGPPSSWSSTHSTAISRIATITPEATLNPEEPGETDNATTASATTDTITTEEPTMASATTDAITTKNSTTATTNSTTSSYQKTDNWETSSPDSKTTATHTTFTRTATLPTIGYNISIDNCTRSMFNGANRTSVIYIITTLYFNVTVKEELNTAEIIEALKSFNPTIELADKCIRKSPDTSTFNVALSKVDPPSSVTGDLSFLTKTDTIPAALVNQANSVTPPIVVAMKSGNYTSSGTDSTSATTVTTLATTETTTIDSTTPNVG